MSLIDFLIIYLACGAPSLVFELTRTDQRSALAKLRLAVLALILWPVHLSILAIFALRSVRQRTKKEKIEAIRKKIELALFGDASPKEVFEFRDVFYRAASLADAVAVEGSAQPSQEIFRTVGHPNPALAARCSARRDREKMIRHLGQTTEELCSVVASEASRAINVNKFELSGDLESLVPGTGERLQALLVESRPSSSVAEPHVAARNI